MGMKRAGMIAGLLGVAAVLTGCGLGGPLDEDTKSYDVTDKVAGLRIGSDSGTVEVVESDRQGIHVTEHLVWRKNKPETSHEVQGDTLALTFKCPRTWGLGSGATSCDVNYKVEVPKGLHIKINSDSGDMTLKGLSGEVDVHSDSGVIEASGLSGKRVITETDSGDVQLAFTAQPDKVVSSSDSGAIRVRVPQGPYNVIAKTDSGAKDITAATDASAPRTIELSSDSGDLEVVTP
ncbi:DUF4097 family beta strand repeat-containing protein [Nonomuraea sp. NPDC050451]|uniref:DUF4097 family beta strand repeat-containing protein n=1 Tax=Nonomuraea sp. NPDC050451 TaxID=3364364 RepID=UPI0037950CDA